MPVYACDKCGTAENTALGNLWFVVGTKEPALCCECLTGKWHGAFPKRPATEAERAWGLNMLDRNDAD